MLQVMRLNIFAYYRMILSLRPNIDTLLHNILHWKGGRLLFNLRGLRIIHGNIAGTGDK